HARGEGRLVLRAGALGAGGRALDGDGVAIADLHPAPLAVERDERPDRTAVDREVAARAHGRPAELDAMGLPRDGHEEVTIRALDANGNDLAVRPRVSQLHEPPPGRKPSARAQGLRASS